MRGRWLVGGLIVSVVLNVFLIGAGAGVVALGQHLARQNAIVRPGLLVRATAGLPQPDRRNIRLMLRQAWIDVRPAAQQSRSLRLEAWTAIGEASPDAQMIKLKLAQSRKLDLDSRTRIEERVVDYAVGLSPASRAIIASGMREVLPPASPVPGPAGS